MVSVQKKHQAFSIILTLFAFCLVCYFGYVLIEKVDSRAAEAQTDVVYQAVRSAALTCFAVEGGYPLELSYLIDHYDLAFDESIYIVEYDCFASNLLPEISVRLRLDIESAKYSKTEDVFDLSGVTL